MGTQKKFKVRIFVETELTVEIEAEDMDEAIEKGREYRPICNEDLHQMRSSYECTGVIIEE